MFCSSSLLEWRRLHQSSLMSHGPFHARKNATELKHVVESVVLIPALTVRAHYQSIVGPSYSNASATSYDPNSPLRRGVISEEPVIPTPQQPSSPTRPHVPPVKRGILSLSTVVESLPEHIKLTHSVLEFIEQVAQPTLAAAAISSSSSSESISSAEGGGEVGGDKTISTASPLSFPVDVTLTFCIRPSAVYLTCQPHSQVECTIQSPNVNFVISFSLFSHQICDGPIISDNTSSTGSLSNTSTRVVPFNNLYVTGCLSTFALQLYSVKPGATSAAENREALSLTLGQALFHLSRKSVSASHNSATCVEDTHNKLQVSGMSRPLPNRDLLCVYRTCMHEWVCVCLLTMPSLWVLVYSCSDNGRS